MVPDNVVFGHVVEEWPSGGLVHKVDPVAVYLPSHEVTISEYGTEHAKRVCEIEDRVFVERPIHRLQCNCCDERVQHVLQVDRVCVERTHALLST